MDAVKIYEDAVRKLNKSEITIGEFENIIEPLRNVEQAPTIKGNTLVVPVSEEDFEKVKRIILDCKPYCRTFYEDAPGEAHWIKSYTPDDGEIYECDNCGVTWQFNDGGPEENEAFYCPKCGFKMVPKDGEADVDRI